MDADYARSKYNFVRRRAMEVRYGHDCARFIVQWAPEAVLSGNTPTETQEPLLAATLRGGGRFYYWVQDFYSLAVDKLLRAKLPVLGAAVGRWYRGMDRRQFQRCAGVVAITEEFVAVLQRDFGVPASRIHVQPNWADIDDLPLQPRANAWSRSQGLDEAFTFLYSGTIGMKHNPALVLSLARWYRTQPQVQVVVVSEGIGADWLRREAAREGLSNLRVLPYQPIEQLPQVLASGDVLLAILEDDASAFSVPSKTLSYLCAGRPLLMSVPLSNLAARTVAQCEGGLVVSPGDDAAWLEGAQRLMDDVALRARLGAHARAYAQATFVPSQVAQAFERIMARPQAGSAPPLSRR
jgi:glycosyltransferase involved in cell wall biosynthesis